MQGLKIAIVGIGATGTVLAAAILSKYPEAVLVVRNPDYGNTLRKKGLRISGMVNYRTTVKNVVTRIEELKGFNPALIFIATKTFHLEWVLKELRGVYAPGTKIVSTQNGLGTEDFVADHFGADATLRMSLNLGASLKNPGEVEVTFFNRPNHLGGLNQKNRELGLEIARMFSDCHLETEFVDDIKRYVWKKMIMKCTMASICAVTDRTIKEALDFPPTREIADACFKEALAVAKAVGYDFGEDYLIQAMGYLEKVGAHKDSMCYDIANKTPTEIAFLGGKIVEYGSANGIPTPFYLALSNLVKAIENKYLLTVNGFRGS